MKSDIVAKHLLTGNDCSNCNCFTHHKVMTVINPDGDTRDVQNYEIKDVMKCTRSYEPEEKVCDEWEKREDIVYSEYLPVYTTGTWK